MSSRIIMGQALPAAAIYCARALNNSRYNERGQQVKPAMINRGISPSSRTYVPPPRVVARREGTQAVSVYLLNISGWLFFRGMVAHAQDEAALQGKKWESLSRAYTEAGKDNTENRANLEGRRVMIVLGANGQLGRMVVVDKIEDQNVHGIVGVYRSAIDVKHKKFTPIQIKNSSDPKEYERIYKAVIQQFELSEKDSVTIVNAIGAPSAKNGQSLYEINVKTASASASAAKAVFDAHNIHHNMNLASTTMASEETICEYGKTKLEAEKAIMDIYGGKNVRVVRIGFPLDIPNNRPSALNPEHMFKTEQLVSFMIPCIAGDGNCVIQPVSLRNVVSVLGKSMEGDARIVNAVGTEEITLHQLHKMLAMLMGKKPPRKMLKIPIEALKIMAERVPAGHLQPYAIEYMASGGKYYSSQEFEEELKEIGETLETAEELYKPKNGETYYFSKLPVLEYLKMVAIAASRDPTVARDVLRAISLIVRENLP